MYLSRKGRYVRRGFRILSCVASAISSEIAPISVVSPIAL